MKLSVFKRYWKLLIVGVVVIASTLFYQLPNFNVWSFDFIHENKGAETFYDAKNILEQYPTVSFLELPAQLKKSYHDPKYDIEKPISNSRFYVIPRKDLLKKIFANNRLNDFVTKEQQINTFWYFQGGQSYLCINEKIIEALFLLQESLIKEELDSRALFINSAYRSPVHNLKVKGAPMSQHIFGKAIDLRIGDINRDQKIDQVDKQIVYKILNANIVANNGGLGFYPGTMIVHMDVRGVRARWDYYKRK